MTLHISPALEEALKRSSEQRNVAIEAIVETAISSYLELENEMMREFAEIEAAHGEALANFEKMLDEEPDA